MKDIVILAQSEFDLVPGVLIDFISDIDSVKTGYRFTFFEGDKITPFEPSFYFALVDEAKGVYKIFAQLPVTAKVQEIKNTITSILNGRYTFEGDKVLDSLGGGRQVSTRDVKLGNQQNGGGILPFDILPQWLQNLMNALGLGGLSLPWWLFATVSAFAMTKLAQKESNKIIWGLLAGLSGIAAIKAYKNK
ncbi:MAG: hypothetical protein IPK91_02730 [Saprospiraceae bacterium]|nr:hypothetical protein [Saprospiraceae bacterium]MBK8296205.1 hypothetical protein [Saprospiraceae bacterium]